MKTYFSKRHSEALRSKKLKLSFAKTLRVSVIRVLNKYSDCGGYNYSENFTIDGAAESLKTFYGTQNLLTFSKDDSGKRIVGTFDDVIERGYPSEVLDAMEAWFDQGTPKSADCEKELNDLFSMNNSPWRFIAGEAILVDSEYLHNEILAKTSKLLRSTNSIGAMEEFHGAIQDFQTGEFKDAVVKAHKSVESVMKTALGVAEHSTFGTLLSRLIKADILPNYYEEFLIHFEKLALGAVKERNRPGAGHGQGVQPTEVPRSLAEFAIHLAGTINLFIIQRWVKKQGKKRKEVSLSNDIPF